MLTKAQATQLPTFGAFEIMETRMENRLSSSLPKIVIVRRKGTPECFRRRAMNQPASQLNPDRDEILDFLDIYFST